MGKSSITWATRPAGRAGRRTLGIRSGGIRSGGIRSGGIRSGGGRIGAVIVMTLMLLAPGAVGAVRAAADVPADEVHYTFTGADSVTVDWRGDATDLRYGSTTDYGATVVGTDPPWTPISSAGPFRQARITGLSPGSTYHYSIGSGPDFTFHTPPTGAFRFDAIGDIGDTTQFSHLGDTLTAIASDQPSFVLMLGDLTYANAANVTQAVVDQHFNDVMRWSTSAAYIPAWGNHEWESPGVDDLRNYKGRLEMPHAQPATGAPDPSCCGDDWGWFDAGGVRFIGYPEPYASGTWTDWQAQANTLMSAAQSDPAVNYVVTYGHRPAYSTGYHPGDTKLAGILDTLGASYGKYVLNINGHSHDYERFQPIHGVTHITAGTPSSEELPWSPADPRTVFRAFHLAHLRVDVEAAGMRIQAVCDAAASHDDVTCAPGSVLDEYTIGTPPQEPPVTAVYTDNTNPACTDLGPGAVDQPFCTIGRGTARLLPGQTLYVGNGTYPEQVSAPSGTATAPVTVAALPGAAPVVGTSAVAHGIYLAGRSHVDITGLSVSGTVSDGVYVTTSDHVTLTGVRVTGSGQPTPTGFAKGFKIIGTVDSTLNGVTADHNTDSGIYLAQGATRDLVTGGSAYGNARGYTRAAAGIDLRSGGNTVRGTVSHDNEDSGIQLYTGADGNLVVDNVSYRNGDHGIDDYQAPDERIVGNSVYRNTTAGINLEGGSTGGLVADNISVDNGLGSPRTVGDIRVDAASQPGATVDSNLVYLHAPGAAYVWGTTNYPTVVAFAAASGQETHGIQADPRWMDPDAGTFALTAGSPAIDSADPAVSGLPDTDIVGTTRYDDPAVPNRSVEGAPAGDAGSYVDRGAYEAPPGTTDASPQPVLAVTPLSGTGPLAVVADAGASTDADATPVASYAFDFGDGTSTETQPGATAGHTYQSAGTYVLTASVRDTAGLTTSTAVQVTVGTTGNLVRNATFETDLTGWAPLPGCTLSRAPGGRNEGWAADLTNPLNTAQTCTLNDSPNWVGRTVAGTYTAAAWVRTATPGGQVKLRIREYVGSTLVGTGTVTVTPTDTWQLVQVSYPVAQQGSTLDLNLYQTNQPAGSDLLIDDVSLSSG